MRQHQVLIVGGGLAGLRAAIAAKDVGADVALLSKVYPIRSHSGAAQGGINAALGNHPDGRDDSSERHCFDTVKGSDFLADQDAAELMAREAPARIYELEHWGCPFSRFGDGRIAQRPFGGAGFPRTCYAADRTGHVILHTLFEQCVKRSVTFYDEWQAVSLAREGDLCVGLVAISLQTGEIAGFETDAVILATGGYGRVYARTTNAIINTGSGMALGYWAGVPLEDMEFVQFHPTTLVGTNILMTEGCRGEGGYLVNRLGERFMFNYVSMEHPELAPRDIVSRSIQTEIDEGRGFDGQNVLLDLRHLGAQKIMERLPGIRELCLDFLGIDPIQQPIPTQPGQHYAMGGVDVDIDCASRLPGLYAAGEVACVSVHGANRLGGNSLLETVVFGEIAGDRAAQYAHGLTDRAGSREAVEAEVRRQQEIIEGLLQSDGPEQPAEVRRELREVMSSNVGIFRDTGPLREAHERVQELRERFRGISLSYKGKTYNLDLCRALELRAKLDLAEAIVAGAVARTESRGSHFHLSFRERNDQEWLRHTLAHYTPEGARLEYAPVTITRFQPEARKY